MGFCGHCGVPMLLGVIYHSRFNMFFDNVGIYRRTLTIGSPFARRTVVTDRSSEDRAKFLEEHGYTRAELQENVDLLGYSFDARIFPRSRFLEKLGLSPTDCPLWILAAAEDKRFCQTLGVRLETYLDFMFDLRRSQRQTKRSDLGRACFSLVMYQLLLRAAAMLCFETHRGCISASCSLESAAKTALGRWVRHVTPVTMDVWSIEMLECLDVPELLPGSPEAKSHHEAEDGEMNSYETVLNLANTMMGSGVLAVPYAFGLTNYWAVLLLFVVVGLTAFTACLIGEKLKMARCKALGGSHPISRDYTYLAEISYGHCGKCVVAVITVLEVWVAAVTFLVMNGSNIQGLLGVSEIQAVLVCTLVSSVMIFIPLRIYAYVSLASLVALLMASMCFLGDLSTISTAKWSYPELQLEPHVGNFFRAYGLFIFCFAGHPCLPALHEGMQHTERWTGCVSWSFSIAAVFYLVLGLVTYLAHGDDLHPVFTKDMSISWLKHMTAAFFAVKIQLTTPVLMRVVLQSMQIWPEGRHVNEFIQNSLPVALVILLTGTSACFLAGEVAALASFVGALLVNLTSIVIPCVMYARLSVWSQQPGKNKVKLVMCGVLVVFGLVTAVAGTYLAEETAEAKNSVPRTASHKFLKDTGEYTVTPVLLRHLGSGQYLAISESDLEDKKIRYNQVMKSTILALCLANSVVPVASDERAAGTLSEMLAKIHSEEFENNFFVGDAFLEKPTPGKEAAAGCILDKVDAIVKENGVTDFVNDLQALSQDCVADVSSAYALLEAVNSRQKDAASTAPKVAAMLIRAVEKRTSKEKIRDSFFRGGIPRAQKRGWAMWHCGKKREDVDEFRQYCSEVISGVSENLCTHYEREIQQLTTDLVNCRSQLSRCAELLAQQLDKEKTYRDIIQKLAESSLRVLQTTPPSLDESMKKQLHDMLEAMHVQNSSLFEDGFGQLHEHKRLAETHLMTSAELQNQGEAIKKELDSIMELLKEPPVRVAKFQLAQPQGLSNQAVQSATKVPQRSEQQRSEARPATGGSGCPTGPCQDFRSEVPKWNPAEAASRLLSTGVPPGAGGAGGAVPLVATQTATQKVGLQEKSQVRFQFGQKSS
eukprot:s2615_g2.t2